MLLKNAGLWIDMKPYKVYDTWVDLDSIVLIDRIYEDIYCGVTKYYCYIHCLFINNPISLLFAYKDSYYTKDQNGIKIREEISHTIAKQRYDKFVEAWKNKDKT